MLKHASIVLLGLVLAACASPSRHFAELAGSFGFTRQELTANGFPLTLYLNPQAQQQNSIPELHVYLDGDGSPFENQHWLNSDPTARNPLILRLMAQDSAPSLLLGRPCYYGLSSIKPCHAELWTTQRYSTQVVQSMSLALQQWLKNKSATRLVFIGYSGGGALAALLAPKFQNTAVLLTLAANLDVDAWSKHHHYPSLPESLNPATEPTLPASILQIHLAGLQDKNVPAGLIETFAKNQANARFVPMADYDHSCCWADDWLGILKRIGS